MKLEELKRLTSNPPAPGILSSQEEIHAYLRSLGLNPGDFYQELEMTSRYVDTHLDVSNSNSHVSLHSHAFYEILYCHNTCDVEYLVGSARYRLQTGDIVIIPPGITHRPLLPESMPSAYRRDVLWLSTDFVHNLIQMFPEDLPAPFPNAQLLRTSGTRWEYLGQMFHHGVRESEQRLPGWEAVVLGNTVQLLVQLSRAIQDRSAASPGAETPELLDRVLAYVDAQLASKITLADVARQFWVSQSTISQTFHNKMGISFYRYVTQRRLSEAKRLIGTGIPMEQVAHSVGFRDYSSFYRAFKAEFGISPAQYKHMLKT